MNSSNPINMICLSHGSPNGRRRSREGLVDLCPWLLLWSSVIGICWIISRQQPFDIAGLFSSFGDLNSSSTQQQQIFAPLNSSSTQQQQIFAPLSSSSTQQQQIFAPPISGTTITGPSIVSFHNHLRCMSESGRWVYNATPRHIPWDYVAENYTDRCDQRHSGLKGKHADQPYLTPQNWTVREELKWVWRTNETCPIQTVDRDKFCKLMGSAKGNVMVVGDSINHGFQWSITNNLIKEPNIQKLIKEGYPVCKVCSGFRICEDVLGREEGFNVSFIRNDRLSMIRKARYEHGGRFIEWPWTDYIKKWKVKILILNRGAHYEADETVLKALNSTFSYIQKCHPHLLVFFRNTPPGHLNCMRYKKPLEKRQNFTNNGGPHNWGKFQRQNRLVKELVEEFGFIYVDADSLLSLRPEGHVQAHDCLHYCIPGPLDSVVELLYNIMRVISQLSQ